MTKLLSKVDILPRMYESLDALHAKMDRISGIIHVFAKKSVKRQIAVRKEISLNQCEIPASSVVEGVFVSEGGQGKVYQATYAGRLSGNILSAQGNWALDPETRRPNPDLVTVITGCARSMPCHAVSFPAGARR